MKYYLIDTSAVVYRYIPSTILTPKINRLIQQRQDGKAFLFMPNFCIAEVFNTFAKYRFRYRKPKKISQEKYEESHENFAEAIQNAKLIYHYELNRYHILNVDYIVPFEHQFYLTRKTKGEDKEWFLSTFDILFISMGIELVRMMGFDNVCLVSDDKRTITICSLLMKLGNYMRKKFGIPSYVIYPQAKLLSSM